MILEVRVLLLVESVHGGGQRHHLLLLDRRHWLDGLHQE